MPALRWLVVGTGHMGRIVAAAAEGVPDSALAAVACHSRESGERLAAAYGGVPVHEDLTEALARSDANVVYVGTPNASHAAQALEAIAAGRHVLCDKPLGVTPEEARGVAAAATGAGVALSVVFQNRHHPTAHRIRDAIRGGEIGRVRLVRASIGFGYEELVGWRAEPARAGAAAVFNLGVHLYDTVAFLLDARVVEVTARVDPRAEPLDRTALALATYGDGTLAYLQVSQELPWDDVRIELLGDAGSLVWDGWMAPYRSGELRASTRARAWNEPSACPDAYERLVASFADSIRTGAPPQPSPDDAIHAVEVATAVIRSGRAGGAVPIPEPTATVVRP